MINAICDTLYDVNGSLNGWIDYRYIQRIQDDGTNYWYIIH